MNFYLKLPKILIKLKQKLRYFLLSLAIVNPFLIPLNTDSVILPKISQNQKVATEYQAESIYPVIQKRPAREVKTVRLTAYSSTPDQTSGNPFITASGVHVHDGTIAANFLSFGTKVRIPEIYGDKIFVVEDRGGMGYSTVDIWFPSRFEALVFGSKYSTIEIL